MRNSWHRQLFPQTCAPQFLMMTAALENIISSKHLTLTNKLYLDRPCVTGLRRCFIACHSLEIPVGCTFSQDALEDCLNLLEDVIEKGNPMVEMLKSEVRRLLELMSSQEIHHKQGRPLTLFSEASHDRQYFTMRGDLDSLRLFSTPRMEKYLE